MVANSSFNRGPGTDSLAGRVCLSLLFAKLCHRPFKKGSGASSPDSLKPLRATSTKGV